MLSGSTIKLPEEPLILNPLDMNRPLNLDQYKQEIATLFDRRSPSYDQGDWHPHIAQRLVEYAQIIPGQQVLDIASGTGLVALEVAQLVGNGGRVVGVDISLGMLEEGDAPTSLLRVDVGFWQKLSFQNFLRGTPKVSHHGGL